jgi:uncharacterized protein (DUF4415 family)
MKTQSKTDWERVKREAKLDAPVSVDMTAEPYDPNDEEAVFAHWEGATIRQNGVVTGQVRRRGPSKLPVKKQVAIRFDADVLDGLRASGKGWQTRVNNVMRAWLESNQAK